MSIVRKKGRTIRRDERNLISNVIKCCENEAKQNKLLVSINKGIDRAALYCSASNSTISRIKREGKINEAKSSNRNLLSTPGKFRRRPDYLRATSNFNSYDRRVIIEILEDFYINKKMPLSVRELLSVLKEKINFKWQRSTLKQLLTMMGFESKYCKPRGLLVERQDIVNKRCNYLQMLKSYKENDWPIFYLDETWVDNNLTFKKYWHNEEFDVNRKSGGNTNRLVIVHIGSKAGFLDECEYIFQAGTEKGVLHGQIMSSENFEIWIKEIVIPKLPSPSVIVMDNASYHSRIVNKSPTKSSMKTDMIEYLHKMGVVCDETMRKCTLYELILSVQPREKTNEVDHLLESYGHKVLRLPPYTSELNPIELAWLKLENYVCENKPSGAPSMQFLGDLVRKGLEKITSEDWAFWCNHVETLENRYWSMDAILEDAVDNLLIESGGFGDNCESENYSEDDEFEDEEEDGTASSGEESDVAFMEGSATF